jgi:crossover junction endodeoxyribonuclease RusA
MRLTESDLSAFNARAASRGEQIAGPLHLQYPVSANRYWRRAGNRTYISGEAVAYKAHVAVVASIARQLVLDGPVSVAIELQPKLTSKGKASRTRLDLDNCVKVVFDAMNGIAYIDDSQVVRLSAFVGEPVKDGGLVVTVTRDGELRR